MTRVIFRRRFGLMAVAATAALVVASSDAEHQYGFGGMGFMGLGMRTVPSPVRLHQSARVIQGRRGPEWGRFPTTSTPTIPTPTSTGFAIMDSVPHYSLDPGGRPGYRPDRAPLDRNVTRATRQPRPACGPQACAQAGGPDRELFQRVTDARLAE